MATEVDITKIEAMVAEAAEFDRDLATIHDIIERGDRLMYQADNFGDRTEFTIAREAWERTSERLRRLASYFEITRDRTFSFSTELAAVVEHVGETLLPGWDVDRDVVKDRPDEDD